jgi:L-arabinose isomerase
MKAGVFSIGLETYWAQFDGLLRNLNAYHSQICGRIAGCGIEVVNGGMVNPSKAEGESLPGPALQAGNTNSRYRFSIGAKQFMNSWAKGGPAHHCAIGLGYIADKIEKLGALLGVEVNKVC